MAQDQINNNLYVAGNISSQTMTIPAASVGDGQVQTASPASGSIQATKLQHQWEDVYAQGSSSTTAAADQKTLHVVRGTTGVVVDYRAGCVVPCVGNATITVDLWKNGVTILSSTISLSSSQTARQTVLAGGFTSTTLAAGDVLEVKITVNAGTGTLGQGLFAMLCIREDPS